MTQTISAYTPGKCNINFAEIEHRRKAAYLGLIVFIVIYGALVGLGFSSWFRLILFAPAFTAAIGFLQTKHKFCVAYGASGKQNATPGSAQPTEVTNQQYIALDRAKARALNIRALLIALVVTLAAFTLPPYIF